MARFAHTPKLPAIQTPAAILRPFAGEKLMLLRAEAKAGAVLPAHAHPHEQITLVFSGRMRLRVGETWLELGPGDVAHVPGGVEHEVVFLEDTVAFDAFHPLREDLLEKLR
ncbi:Cupin domain protein [Meiothermus luteus]|jgi:quercetin dioxygenase-like cupin family protein|uniref:Cupin domain protein n=1 Tax=Meiothermus luteus TaxID=2026184 RepID=A0A399EXS4_9DEIN|nr:cupin domain-containing protein [Meiothermus luteus]RIH88395.1 Cupin domain protein [Meiothermus luteus]RMH54855.1 MAG: cupin domain-containing protein [Deinococcota bacterium]